MRYSVLVVDDDQLVNDFVVEAVKRLGFSPVSVGSGEEAITTMKKQTFDIVLTDLRMGEVDGMALIDHVKRLNPNAVIVLMTAYGTVETAVQAIRKGAYDFLLKPVSPDQLAVTLSRVTDLIRLRGENEILRNDMSEKYHTVVGKSKAMNAVFETVRAAANSRSTVLLTGGSGSGKEMVARLIHQSSGRRNGPFIKLNCAALPDTLVEAELFGYEKGAFTDAKRTHRGRFELAHTGTLLLDEISEMPLHLQAKLLRVLQEREFERVGSSETIQVDVRIVATSNRNLKQHIAEGRFREDLYYRLEVIPIHLPELRERPEDIPLLVEHFIEKYNQENNKTIMGVTAEAMKLLTSYHWRGNVRELENVIEGAVVRVDRNMIESDDLPLKLSLPESASSDQGLKLPMTIAEGNRYLVLKTLELTSGNKTRAAEFLDVTPRTIRNWLSDWGLHRPQKGEEWSDSDDHEVESERGKDVTV